MLQKSTLVLVAFIMFLLMGFLFLTRAYSDCSSVTSGLTTCTIYEFFKDFKDVIGWGIALYVAYIASRPVWKQLDLMHLDVDIASIKFLEQEISSIKQLRSDVLTSMESLTVYIADHTQLDEPFAWCGNEHATAEAENLAMRTKNEINELNSNFGNTIEVPYSELIEAISKLYDCLHDIRISKYPFLEELFTAENSISIIENGKHAIILIDSYISNLHDAQTRFESGIAKAVDARIALISEKKNAMFSAR
ncbi:MAG: hypothetical protein GX458_02865 [Phyllobacteriaceae bacterium]|nr:hypothetical protein [Phyllobacteriaceae bacterium]